MSAKDAQKGTGLEEGKVALYTMSVVFDQALPTEHYKSVWFVIDGRTVSCTASRGIPRKQSGLPQFLEFLELAVRAVA